MEFLQFSGVKDSKIIWSGDYNTRFESGKLTQIACDEFERIGHDSDMEFHYELHFGDQGYYVRLCCHYRPYNEFKNLKKEELLDKLRADNKIDLFDKREKAKQRFAEEFCVDNCEVIAAKFNYLGFIRREIKASDYNGALQEVEQFIVDTYDKALEIIQEVFG